MAYRYRGLVHYHHRGKQGATQADIMLEKELTILHLDQLAAGREKKLHWTWLKHVTPQNPPPGTHFLLQDHAYFNKATPLIVAPHVSLWGPFSFKPSQSVNKVVYL